MTRHLNIGSKLAVAWLVASLGVAGCTTQPVATPAEQAETSACTAQADAGYQASNYDALSRTTQNGLYFAPDPNHVFDAQRMGSLHVRDSQIAQCEQNGDDGGAIAPGTPIVTPHIVSQ